MLTRFKNKSRKWWLLLLINCALLVGALSLVSALFESGEKEVESARVAGRIVIAHLDSGMVRGGAISVPSVPDSPQVVSAPEETPIMDAALLPPPGEGLKPAPADELTEKTDKGPLPMISPEGVKPWRYYAREGKGSGSAKIAIVIDGLGLNKKLANLAVRLPADISLSFSAYAPDAAIWAASARSLGHEVYINLPVEPSGYPNVDPGPRALLASNAGLENEARMRRVLSRFPGYVGVTIDRGERLTLNSEMAEMVVKFLNSRGLMAVVGDSGGEAKINQLLKKAGMPYMSADVVLGSESTRAEIYTALQNAESAARQNGQYVLVASAHPLLLEILSQWVENAEQKGLTLVPVSSLARLKFS